MSSLEILIIQLIIVKILRLYYDVLHYSILISEENWQDRKRRMMEEERQRQLKDMMLSKQEPVPSGRSSWSKWPNSSMLSCCCTSGS